MRKARTVAALVTLIGTGALPVSQAAADPAPTAAEAVAAARGAGCGPLGYDPVVERAAEIVNRSTMVYLNHTGENIPADGPHPTAILSDLGIDAGKDLSLHGAGQDEVNALKGLLIQGYKAIPDCSYTDFGASHLYDEQTGFHLITVILVTK
ncbi:hypothetical protein MHOL44478_14690 [Mycobacterium holsaticum DSM 44478]|nr:hypothetical protein [Mycolicibacterium holsaticum DSM 44478 = JCM 12374]